jgi:hyperosmotically inducible periplasmic protein
METKFTITLTLIGMLVAFMLGSLQAAYAGDFGTADSSNQEAYASVFRSMDKDNDGTLEKSEVKNDKLFKDSFAEADTNNDGLLDMNEYSEHRRQKEQQNVKRVYNDAELVTKVKAQMAKDVGLKTLKINVDAYKGTVILSGFVDSASQAKQAEQAARSVQGVQTVKNSLVVKGQ